MIDEKFLEFWGNLLIHAARGQKQTNDFFQLMRTGFSGFTPSATPQTGYEDMYASFRKFYGLDKLSEKSENYRDMTDKATRDFNKAFKEYLSLMGVCPLGKHLALVEKYEKLKEKCERQEETIEHLKMLLDSRQSPSVPISGQIGKIAKNQGELFLRMMNDFNPYLKEKKTGEEEPDEPEPSE